MGICHPMKNEKNCFTSHQISVGYSPPRKERSHLQIHSKMSLLWNPYGDLHVDSDFEKDQFVDLRNYYSSLWDYYNHDLCLEITILYIPKIVKENLFLTCIKLLKCTSWRYSLTSVFFWWVRRRMSHGLLDVFVTQLGSNVGQGTCGAHHSCYFRGVKRNLKIVNTWNSTRIIRVKRNLKIINTWNSTRSIHDELWTKTKNRAVPQPQKD